MLRALGHTPGLMRFRKATCIRSPTSAFVSDRYPHFRALFATVTSQAGLMLPPLPIMSEQPRRVDKVLQSFGDIEDRGQEEAH